MAHYRIRHRRLSNLRWRLHMALRRAALLLISIAATRPGSVAALEHPAMPLAKPLLTPVGNVLHVGDYVVSEEGDPQLLGHPNIRY
ncbi:MAG: hypothetical protein NVSMB30_09160 [Hymenobacter sp.]